CSVTLPSPPLSPLFPYTTLFRSRPSPLSLPDQTVAFDFLVEIAAGHLQCARGFGDIPVVLLQLGHQERALRRQLELLEGRRFERSEEHTSELQSLTNLVSRLLLA